MKIAVISDIHGNMEALDAVLNDIDAENCNKIFCLGDIALAGPEPSAVIDRIQELSQSDDFSLIQGNTDEMLSEFSQEVYDFLAESNSVMANAYKYDASEITEGQSLFLKNMDKNLSLNIDGVNVLLVHGSPRKNNENIFPDLALSEVEEMLLGVQEDLIFCGHTHVPCGYQTSNNKTVVNVGSVGRPFSEKPLSCYVLFEIDPDTASYSVEHKFVKYDYKNAAKKLAERRYEGAEKLAAMLERSTSRYP